MFHPESTVKHVTSHKFVEKLRSSRNTTGWVMAKSGTARTFAALAWHLTYPRIPPFLLRCYFRVDHHHPILRGRVDISSSHLYSSSHFLLTGVRGLDRT